MVMTARFVFRCNDSMAADVEDIAVRTGLPESEVIRRLIRLGVQDVDDIGDEVLFGTVSDAGATSETD
jgi:hypothetical protein